MYQRILHFSRRPFIRNVVTVASGTAAAQAISMIFAPLITRLYGPEAYGLQGVFMSVGGIMGAIGGMTYPLAIVLPRSDSDAIGLVWLSIYLSGAMAVLAAIIFYFFGAEALVLLNAEKISAYIYLLPVFMFITVLSTVLGQWFYRKKIFGLNAKVMVGQMLIVNMIKTGLGFLHPSAAALIATNTFGGLLGSVMMLLGLFKTSKTAQKEIDDLHKTVRKNQRAPKGTRKARRKSQKAAKGSKIKSSIWVLAKVHRDFPLLRAPQLLLNTISQSLPVMMLTTYFGSSSAGFYSIAVTVLGIPIGLIGNSIMPVFYSRINEAIHRGEDVRALIIKATIGLALSGALPFGIVIIAGPTLFGYVFGNEWRTAGVYAQWLSIWLFFQHINRPAVSAIPPLRLQRGLLIYELFSTGTKVLALYIGFVHFQSDVYSVALFSIFGMVAYIWLILWVIIRSNKLVDQS